MLRQKGINRKMKVFRVLEDKLHELFVEMYGHIDCPNGDAMPYDSERMRGSADNLYKKCDKCSIGFDDYCTCWMDILGINPEIADKELKFVEFLQDNIKALEILEVEIKKSLVVDSTATSVKLKTYREVKNEFDKSKKA